MARDLRLFYLFRLLSTSYLFVPIELAYATSRGLSFTQAMFLSTIYSLVVILTELPTGVLADRIGRRAAMMAGALAMVAACAVFTVAKGFPTFAVGSALSALSMTLCSGADSAYLFDLLNDNGQGHEYPRREGTASAWHQAGQALAFAAGGLLAARDLALPYIVTGGVATLAFLVAVFMREGRASGTRPNVSVREYVHLMREALTTVGTRDRLIWAIAYSAVVFALLRATIYILQPYLASAGFGMAQAGFIFAAMYLAATAVSHRADALRRRFAEPTLLWLLLGTLVVTFLLLGGSVGPWSLAVLVVQAGANGLYSPLVKPLLNREIDDSGRRATVLSVESMVRRAALGIFSPLVGTLMERYGASAGLLSCGLVGAIGLAILVVTFRAPTVPAVGTPEEPKARKAA
ncbi:MAG: MFS transporter [Deltaproteobacteria bacterium]|nr:MFS transporter [Deltaproteobacteria bacterium]